MNLKRIGLDTSKAVFTLHCVDRDEKAVLRRNGIVRETGMCAVDRVRGGTGPCSRSPTSVTGSRPW